MIYQDVKRYLKKQIVNPSINFKWSEEDNIAFFTYLKSHYTEEEISKNISEVKEAFRDFFEPVGTIVFKYTKNKIQFRVFPYKLEPQNSKYLDAIIEIIKRNKDSVIYNYNGNKNQIVITGKIRRDINFEINIHDEPVNKKELIKYAIRKALNLSERDIIIQLKRKYLIKIFNDKKSNKNGRFNGYSKEEVEEGYKTIFKKISIDEFLMPLIENVFKDKLNFSKISNEYYETNALKILQNEIAKELSDYSALEEDFLFGLAGYILRENFYKIHYFMAKKLLEYVYRKNQKAEEFLRYYTTEYIIKYGNKYKIPILKTKEGNILSYALVVGVNSLWFNAKTKITSNQKKLSEIKNKILNLQKNKTEENLHQIEALKKEYRDIETNINILNKTLKTNESKMNEILDALTNSLMRRKKLV